MEIDTYSNAAIRLAQVQRDSSKNKRRLQKPPFINAVHKRLGELIQINLFSRLERDHVTVAQS